tara:strand:+ start:6938 stop:7414 length:477 start_codon:yes stop_codon:yes gene_type:complete
MNKKSLITAAFVGLVASIIFIIVQPIFGMATLTSRHALAYVTYGAYSETSALILSWFVHISVSVCYALLSMIIFNINRSLLVCTLQVVILGWITTLIATPANEFVVKLVTTSSFPALSSLSAINTQVGPKLWLHIVFFVFVMVGIWLASMKDVNNNKA